MGLSEEEQRKAHIQMNDKTEELNSKIPKQETEAAATANDNLNASSSCCQGTASSSCCQNGAIEEKSENHHVNSDKQEGKIKLPRQRNKESKPSCSTRKMSTLPTWFECWEREDTYAALSVVTAVASVAVAYSCYRQLR